MKTEQRCSHQTCSLGFK